MMKKSSIKTDFTTMSIMLIPIAVAINFVAGYLSSLLKLPVYMDTIGTTLIGFLCGPWVGATAGGMTNLVSSITSPQNIYYMPCNILIGLIAGFFSRKDWWRRSWKCLIAFVILDLTVIISSSVISVLVYGGVTAAGTGIMAAVLMATGQGIWQAVIGTELIWTTVDRFLAHIIAMATIRVISARTLIKLPLGEFYINDKRADKSGKDK